MPDPNVEWTGGALLYAGRADPNWVVPSALARNLVRLWETLPLASVPPPPLPPLGYRGAVLHTSAGERWIAVGGAVTRQAEGLHESRIDAGGKFEQLVLRSAPAGLLPDGLLR